MSMSKKQRLFLSVVIAVFLCVTLLGNITAFAVGEEAMINKEISLSHPITYGFFAIISLALLIGYCILKKKKYLWMLIMLISVFIINVGYFALSLSNDVYEALLACRISYFGNSFMPLFMLLTLADICRFKIKKGYWYALLAISVIMSGIAISAGYGSYFYKSVAYQVINGNVELVKSYGFLHTIYGIYVYTYYFMSVAIAVYSIIKKKILFLRYVTMVVAVSASNILVWTIERFITNSFEFLSVSYVLMEAMLMILYSEMTENGFLNCFRMVSDNEIFDKPGDVPEPTFEEKEIIGKITERISRATEEAGDNTSVGAMKEADFTQSLVEKLTNEYRLTNRELEVLVHLTDGKKRKTIAEKMFVSENTVKYHVSSVYQKLGVNSREGLCKKVDELRI